MGEQLDAMLAFWWYPIQLCICPGWPGESLQFSGQSIDMLPERPIALVLMCRCRNVAIRYSGVGFEALGGAKVVQPLSS